MFCTGKKRKYYFIIHRKRNIRKPCRNIPPVSFIFQSRWPKLVSLFQLQLMGRTLWKSYLFPYEYSLLLTVKKIQQSSQTWKRQMHVTMISTSKTDLGISDPVLDPYICETLYNKKDKSPTE